MKHILDHPSLYPFILPLQLPQRAKKREVESLMIQFIVNSSLIETITLKLTQAGNLPIFHGNLTIFHGKITEAVHEVPMNDPSTRLRCGLNSLKVCKTADLCQRSTRIRGCELVL